MYFSKKNRLFKGRNSKNLKNVEMTEIIILRIIFKHN